MMMIAPPITQMAAPDHVIPIWAEPSRTTPQASIRPGRWLIPDGMPPSEPSDQLTGRHMLIGVNSQ